MIAALALAAAVPLAWEGTAKVYDGGIVIPITVRSRVEASGRVVSESWPTALGEAKGLRRFALNPEGSGTIERGGKSEAAPADFVREEKAQFGVYQQMQEALRRCAGSEQVTISGAVATSFRCGKGGPTSAANWVAAPGAPVRQDFRMIGWWRDGQAVFPRRLVIKRDGKPFFDLTVTHFRSR